MENELTLCNSTCKWPDIKSSIEADIFNGRYRDAIMPSIAETAAIYHCGKSTVQKVLEALCQDGILTRKKGVGYFIKPRAVEQLKNDRTHETKSEIRKVIQTAKNFGIDLETLLQLFTACADETYQEEG